MELNADPRSPHDVRLRDLPLSDALRVLWWSVRVTPTSRVRYQRFHESIRDGRGRAESMRIARSCGA